MEFVEESQVTDILRENGLTQVGDGPERVLLHLAADDAVRIHLVATDADIAADEGATEIKVSHDDLASRVVGAVHRLPLEDALLIPIGRWRNVFDAVAFGLADNEEWQEVDAAATVELNARDPLLCGPPDQGTLQALIEAIYRDAENDEQGFMIISPAAPLLILIVPGGAARMSFGSQALADQALEALQVS